MVNRTWWASGLKVTADGAGIVSLAGTSLVRFLAEQTGLRAAVAAVVNPAGKLVVHDRGQVVCDLAAMVMAGGEAISDIDTLRGQNVLVGSVASMPTAWRTLESMTPRMLTQVERARARIRAGLWKRITVPAVPVAGRTLGATVVLDIDATLVTSHSEKEQAAATFKKGFGYHPLACWCDNTAELLAIRLRPGNAGSNTAVDHIEVLTAAFAQVPWPRRRDLLVRVDGAGASHALLDWLTAQDAKHLHSVQYSVGFTITDPVRDAIAVLPEHAWTTAIDTDGDLRDGAQVAEITGVITPQFRDRWPSGMRLIVRRERPHPGAQLDAFEEADGWRYQVIATNTRLGQHGFLDARHRAHARVENRIAQAKDTGLGRFPSRSFAINAAWSQIVAIAADLTAWLQLIGFTADLATCRIKTLRHRVLTAPARLTRHARGRTLAFPADWPWAAQITDAFTRIAAFDPG